MADCSKQFLDFHQRINLSPTATRYLRSSRKAVIGKIQKYFSENGQCPKVLFKGQGFFSMGTIIRP